jgi:putative FmdB family regulatory protein
MPIYEYSCSRCRKIFYLPAKEPPKSNPNCPNCGNEKTVREWNAPPIVFKGKGFYTTDNKDKENEST